MHFFVVMAVTVTVVAYGPPPPSSSGGSGCGSGCGAVGGGSHVVTTHVSPCAGGNCRGASVPGVASSSGDYWWQGQDNPFAQPASHPSSCSGTGCASGDASCTGSGCPSASRPVPVQNLLTPMGICEAKFVCVHWQLCRNGLVIDDGTGIINKQIKEIPPLVTATYTSCGGDMICCGVPIGADPSLLLLTPGTPHSSTFDEPSSAHSSVISHSGSGTIPKSPISPPKFSGSVATVSPPKFPGSATPVSPPKFSGSAASPSPPKLSGSVAPVSPPKFSGSAASVSPPKFSGSAAPVNPSKFSGSAAPVSPPKFSGSATSTRPSSGTPARPHSVLSVPHASDLSIHPRPVEFTGPGLLIRPGSLAPLSGSLTPSSPASQSSDAVSSYDYPGSGVQQPSAQSPLPFTVNQAAPVTPFRPLTPVSSPVGLVSPPSGQQSGGMAGMMGMMGMMPRSGSCSAGTYCVLQQQCNPYTGFIIRDNNPIMAVWPDSPTVPVLPCFVPDGSVTNGVCCQEAHPNAGGID